VSTTAKNSPSRVEVAKAAVLAIADRSPGRRIHVTGDAACLSQSRRRLPAGVSWTSRGRRDAALYEFAPARTGRRGRPKTKGHRLPELAGIATNAEFARLEVRRYSPEAHKTVTVEVHAFTCLWYGVLATEIVKVVMVRDAGEGGYGIAIISTDVHADPEMLIERYARRWSIEVAFEEGKEVAGVADARNRVRTAVQRTVPFCFYSMSILVVWFALSGVDHDAIVAERRRIAPWYATKTSVSFADISTIARRVLMASRFDPLMVQHPERKKSRSSVWQGMTSPRDGEKSRFTTCPEKNGSSAARR
jgi:hypothetical protein